MFSITIGTIHINYNIPIIMRYINIWNNSNQPRIGPGHWIIKSTCLSNDLETILERHY